MFAMGCGRLFEGTAEQMFANMQKLGTLDDATRVYCAHEYTLSNARFAVTVDPDNEALAARLAAVEAGARQRVGMGKRVVVSVGFGAGRYIKQKKKKLN